MPAHGPSRHIAPPRDLGRQQSIAEVDGQPSVAEDDARDPKLMPSIPHRSALRCSLFFERPAPCARSYANNAGEVSREMSLIAEAALRCHIGERQPVIAQLFLG
jgi:hypothetical protein